jgi:hypothetical protein
MPNPPAIRSSPAPPSRVRVIAWAASAAAEIPFVAAEAVDVEPVGRLLVSKRHHHRRQARHGDD